MAEFIKLHKSGHGVNKLKDSMDARGSRLPLLYEYEGAHTRRNDLQTRFIDEPEKKRDKPRYKCC